MPMSTNTRSEAVFKNVNKNKKTAITRLLPEVFYKYMNTKAVFNLTGTLKIKIMTPIAHIGQNDKFCQFDSCLCN